MTLQPSDSKTTNNKVMDDCSAIIPSSELDLLAKLEAANKLIESDAKSLNSLHSNHSRKNSDTSQISNNFSSGNSLGEEDVWTTWATILNDWEGSLKKKTPCVRELVRRGIPHHFRPIVWQLLCGASEIDKKQYAEYIKATSACEKVIRRDIARTYPEHDFFKEKDGLGQEALFNVMKAYSLHDREVGYCQGSGFIVGLLLMHMPEEEAFAVLVQIMQQHRMRDMFKPSMAELGLCMYQLENLVHEHLPELHIHFQLQGFHTSMYASSWFLTLYTTNLNIQISSRIMDIFLSEGMEFIFKVGLALLTLGKDALLSLDMEAMLKTVPGHIFRGKRRLVKMVSKCASNTLEREYKIQDNNMMLLRHSYLSVDESAGHTKDLNKRSEIIKKWRDEQIKNKLKDHIKLEDRLLHLNVNKVWE